jgi:hypothetical protein
MDANEDQMASADSHCEFQRAIIRPVLNDIATELGSALRAASLEFEVFMTVPNSGKAIATLATPDDPTDDDWSEVAAIACRMIGRRLGDIRLHGRPLSCAMASSSMIATEVTADVMTDL